MLDTLSLLVVAFAGTFLVALAFVSLAAPSRASSFLMGFASSAAIHYSELLLRVVAGLAFIVQARSVPFPLPFTVFGWLLIGTSAGLVLIPWRQHRRFVRRTVPPVLVHLRLVAVASLALGGFVLWSSFRAAV